MSPSTRRLNQQAVRDLEHALRRRALRQSITLRAAGAAIAYAPTLDDCAAAIERSKEELAHLEHTVELFAELCGGDLTERIEAQLRAVPLPDSWLEASIALLVLCLAARVEAGQELIEARGSAREQHKLDGVTRLLARELAEENEHVDAARAALRELCVFSAEGSKAAAAHLSRWLKITLDVLGDDSQRVYLETLRCDISLLGLALNDCTAAA